MFDDQTVSITRKRISILKIQRDHQTELWCLTLHIQQTGKQDLHVEPTRQAKKMGLTKTYQTFLNTYMQNTSAHTHQL